MAWAPLAIALVGTAMQMGGKYGEADAARVQATQVRAGKQFEADQMEQNAEQAQAAAQRTAAEARHRSKLIASRALALGGASGAGMSDPTMAGILTDIGADGVYRSAVAIYEGDDKARRLRMGAEGAEYEGQVMEQGLHHKAKALEKSALGSAMQMGGSLFSKYGGGGPKADTGSLSAGTGYMDAGTPLFNPVA